jgi:hypothetical protein
VSERTTASDTGGLLEDRAIHEIADHLLSVPVTPDRTPEPKINLQRDDSKAKVYQVRQVRGIILKYKLGGQA